MIFICFDFEFNNCPSLQKMCPVFCQPPAHFKNFFSLQRREGDSNPRYRFAVHTLSRRASSATPAPLQYSLARPPKNEGCKLIKNCEKKTLLFTNFPAQTFIEVHFDFVRFKALPEQKHQLCNCRFGGHIFCRNDSCIQ